MKEVTRIGQQALPNCKEYCKVGDEMTKIIDKL